jgi:hypothetical protein
LNFPTFRLLGFEYLQREDMVQIKPTEHNTEDVQKALVVNEFEPINSPEPIVLSNDVLANAIHSNVKKTMIYHLREVKAMHQLVMFVDI